MFGNLGLVRVRIIALVVELCLVFTLLNTSDFLVLEEKCVIFLNFVFH